MTRMKADRLEGDSDADYSKPHRWQGALDQEPNAPLLACPFHPTPDFMLAIDTSGSMGTKELGVGIREVRGALEETEASSTLIGFDAAVNEVKEIRSVEEALKCLKGGGGTDFVPLFEYIEKLPKRPSVLYIYTDGIAPAPEKPPVDMDVVWVLIGRHRRKPWPVNSPGSQEITWGEFIEIPTEDEEKEAA
jgi:hypothetical protein